VNSVDVENRPSQLDAVPASGIRTYVLLFCTQWFAMTATALTGLVLGIYVYRQMDRGAISLIMLGIAYAGPYLPFVVTSPFAGALVDRWGQRNLLLIANTGTILNSSTLIILLLNHAVTRGPAVTILAIAAALKGLQLAAIESSVPLLVPKRHIMRANGSRMILTGTAAVMAPVLATLLLLVIPQIAIIALECVAVAIAIVAASRVRIPRAAPVARAPKRSLTKDIGAAAKYLKGRRGLWSLIAFLGGISVVIGIIEVSIAEIAYGFTDGRSLAVILTGAWTGMLVASIAITITGRPHRLIKGMLTATLVFAAGMIASGLRPNVLLVTVAAFVGFGVTPIIMAALHTVFHTKVEPGVMGRTMGLKNMVIGGSHLSGNVLAGLLGAALLPLVGRQDVRSDALALLIGHGHRWYALVMILVALVLILITYLAHRSRALTRLQDDLPDVTPEDTAAGVPDAPTSPGAPRSPGAPSIVGTPATASN
jgi:DHA3 family macrolide efflux protein-like MFS transporter